MYSNHHKHKVRYFYLRAVVAVAARKAHNLEVGGSNASRAIDCPKSDVKLFRLLGVKRALTLGSYPTVS